MNNIILRKKCRQNMIYLVNKTKPWQYDFKNYCLFLLYSRYLIENTVSTAPSNNPLITFVTTVCNCINNGPRKTSNHTRRKENVFKPCTFHKQHICYYNTTETNVQ